MATWTNNDGLKVLFGTTQGQSEPGGEPVQAGATRKLVVDVDLTQLADANAAYAQPFTTELGDGWIINSVTATVLTAATSGGSAVLDLGVIKAGTAGTDDDDGFDAAVALTAIDTIGEVVNCDGALVNTELDADYHFAASYDTAAFTAGLIRVVIEYTPTENREDQ